MSSILLGLYLFVQIVHADELVIVKGVSSTRKRFVIQKGGIDGISKGQTSVFTTKSATVAARAIEVTHTFSLWEVEDPRASFPFDKNDFVAFNNSLDTMILEIPRLKENTRELIYKEEKSWVLRGSYALALSESVSEADSDSSSGRTSFQFEALYSYKWGPQWEALGGIRIDRDNATLQEPELDIPSQRMMVAGELLYHFDYLKGTEDNIYIGTGIAYGRSQTTIEDTVSVGSAMVMPILKLGYQNKLESGSSLLLEAVTESIAVSEAFEDTETQNTNIVNVKFSIGYKF
ncbi:MAG: hypothetical protein OHK0056_06110 [Bacteriovoracaceae bacterium]